MPLYHTGSQQHALRGANQAGSTSACHMCWAPRCIHTASEAPTNAGFRVLITCCYACINTVTCTHQHNTCVCRNSCQVCTWTQAMHVSAHACTLKHTLTHKRLWLPGQAPYPLVFPTRRKSQSRAQQVSKRVGLRGGQWGRGARSPGSHGVPPGTQAAGPPGHQTQTHAERS